MGEAWVQYSVDPITGTTTFFLRSNADRDKLPKPPEVKAGSIAFVPSTKATFYLFDTWEGPY